MKPQRKTVMLEFEFWDCGNPNHRHYTEAMAAQCIAIAQRAAPRARARILWPFTDGKKCQGTSQA
jgi:hypothetical protein